MSKRHFLIHAGARDGAPTTPPQRWLQAFPDGQWSTWTTLQATVRAADTVWLPVTHPEWLDCVRRLQHIQGAAPVVVLSPVPNDAEGLRALDAGARGYVHLLAVPAVLREVEHVVRHGGLWVGPELMQRLLAATRQAFEQVSAAPQSVADLALLSEREAQVARAVAAGKSNREVADQLCISERTVKAHLGSVFDKLGVRDRLQLALRLSGGATTPDGTPAPSEVRA
ncbi:MAG: response regulator transcription factor [Pseudomonadota bacterium]